MREHLITMVRALIRDRMRVNMSSWRQHFSASIPRQNLSNFYKSFRCFANGLRPTKSVSLIIALNLVTTCCGFWQIMVKLIPAQIYSSQGNESFPAYCTFYSSNSFVKQPWQSEMPKLPIASYKGDLKAVISTAHNCLPKPTRCFEFQLKDGQASRLASLVSCTGHFCILLTQLSQPAPWYRMFEAQFRKLWKPNDWSWIYAHFLSKVGCWTQENAVLSLPFYPKSYYEETILFVVRVISVGNQKTHFETTKCFCFCGVIAIPPKLFVCKSYRKASLIVTNSR